MLFEDNILYSTFAILILIMGALGMMCCTTKFRYDTKRIALVLCLYLIYAATSTLAIIAIFGFELYLRVYLVTISAPAIVLVFKMTGDQPAKAVFNYATQILAATYMGITLLLLNDAIGGTELTDFVIRITSFIIVILFEYRFVRPAFLHLTAIIETGWLVLALIPCSLLIFAAVLVSYPAPYTPSGVLLFYLLGIAIIVIYFSIFQNLTMQYRLQLAKQNADFLELQMNHLKDKLSADAFAAEKSRIDRHDTRHMLCTAAALLKDGNVSDALDYISQSVRRFETHTPVQYCQDVIINATLSSYFEQAKEAGIVLKTCLQFSDMLPVDSGEFAIVLANALENAINACRLLPKEARRIDIRCISTPKLLLEISNPCSEPIAFSADGLPIATENGHGIGTRSIYAFCKKYHALYDFSVSNGQFILRIAL